MPPGSRRARRAFLAKQAPPLMPTAPGETGRLHSSWTTPPREPVIATARLPISRSVLSCYARPRRQDTGIRLNAPHPRRATLSSDRPAGLSDPQERAAVTAARLSASCSGRLAPMIGAVTAGLASTQATARVARLIPASAATAAQGLDGGEFPVMPVARLIHRPRIAQGEARALGRLLRVGMLAGEKPAGQRVIGNDGDAFFPAERQQVALEGPEEQIVAGLGGGDPGQALHLRPADGARDPDRRASWRRRYIALFRIARSCRGLPAPRPAAWPASWPWSW